MSASNFVVMFKGDGSEKQPDHYVQELQKIGLDSVVVPVLNFEFINSDQLLKELQCPENYSGIIFTSIRAVEAVQKSLQINEDIKTILLDQWNYKQNFSVGEATSDAAKSSLNLNCNGKNAGNSKVLCEIIIKSMPYSDKPLLYPCSNIRKDSVHKILNASGIKVTEVISYETTCHPLLQQSWEMLIQSKRNPEYLVFFSPSGVRFAIPILLNTCNDISLYKLITVGPSTEEAIRSEGQVPWKVAEKPNSKSLCEVLQSSLPV